MKVIFMGSPLFAVPALEKLLSSTCYDVVCVYTREPKPSGRGKKVNITPIHALAERYKIPVLTPKTLKDSSITYEADFIVLTAYGMLLPKHILKYPKYGCINIHPSLLPRWRGAAPIHHALLAGDEKTGVCIMQMTEGLDSGDILSMKKVQILDVDDYQILHDKLAKIGAEMLLEVMDNINYITPLRQNNEGITYASKVKKEPINWQNSAEEILRKIRAFQGALCTLKGKKIKILKAHTKTLENKFPPGSVLNNKLHIACSTGVIIPEIVQLPGKVAMDINDFIKGNPLWV